MILLIKESELALGIILLSFSVIVCFETYFNFLPLLDAILCLRRGRLAQTSQAGTLQKRQPKQKETLNDMSLINLICWF